MPKSKMTPEDIKSLGEEYREILLDEERMAEGGPDDVMTSIGYVSLWADGDVTTPHDGSLGQFDSDGDWTPNDDDGDDDGDDGDDGGGEGEE